MAHKNLHYIVQHVSQLITPLLIHYLVILKYLVLKYKIVNQANGLMHVHNVKMDISTKQSILCN